MLDAPGLGTQAIEVGVSNRAPISERPQGELRCRRPQEGVRTRGCQIGKLRLQRSGVPLRAAEWPGGPGLSLLTQAGHVVQQHLAVRLRCTTCKDAHRGPPVQFRSICIQGLLQRGWTSRVARPGDVQGCPCYVRLVM